MKCDTQTHVTVHHLSREWLWISVPMQMYLWAAWCLRPVSLEICVFAILFVNLLQTTEERHQPGSGVLQSHIQSWPLWGMASGISCVCACWRGGRQAAGAWTGRDEKTKAKHGAHVTGRSCLWVKGNYKRAHTPADNSLLSARADI